MGDYNTHIYTGAVKKMTADELTVFEKEVENRMPNHMSAYHSVAPVIAFDNSWDHETRFTFVGQCKTSFLDDAKDFENWLRPQVTDGVGQLAAWVMRYTEYCNLPMVEFVRDFEEPHG
jgi:hypothetical protein